MADMMQKTKRNFQIPGNYLAKVFTNSINLFLAEYDGYKIQQIKDITASMNCIPEFLGHETYLMFKTNETEHAKEIVNIFVPLHVGMILIDKVVDKEYPPSPELYLALDLIYKSERKLLDILPNSNYLHKHMVNAMRTASEAAALSDDCSLSEYQNIIEKLSYSYTICTILPAMIAGVTDANILSLLENYSRYLYVALHLLDDIHDVEEDKNAHRPNYVVLSGSKEIPLQQCEDSLDNASNYISKVPVENFHKQYMKWLCSFFLEQVERAKQGERTRYRCTTCGREFSSKEEAVKWRRNNCQNCPNRFSCPCWLYSQCDQNLKEIEEGW